MFEVACVNKEIIRLENVSVRFNLAAQKNSGIKDYLKRFAHHGTILQEFFALRNVNLTIGAGESWGFVGCNGSGKSTLLKVICGIYRPYTGNVTVRGCIAPMLELGAGFDGELTGRENIMMNGLILGMTKAEIRSRFDWIVDFSELKDFLDVPIKNYSSGMKSRLGFSIATSYKPDILIADEVLSTGDRNFQKKCEQRMKELLSDGTTLLFVSHSPGAISEMCDHAVWLDKGQIRMKGAAQSVIDAYNAMPKGR